MSDTDECNMLMTNASALQQRAFQNTHPEENIHIHRLLTLDIAGVFFASFSPCCCSARLSEHVHHTRHLLEGVKRPVYHQIRALQRGWIKQGEAEVPGTFARGGSASIKIHRRHDTHSLVDRSPRVGITGIHSLVDTQVLVIVHQPRILLVGFVRFGLHLVIEVMRRGSKEKNLHRKN